MTDRIHAALHRLHEWLRDVSDAWARALSVAGLLAVIGGAIVAAAHCSGCSGAAMPVVTVPITVHCSWSIAGAGGDAAEDEGETAQARRTRGAGIIDSDCMVRDVSPSTSPQTTGNEVETGDITPSLDVTASGTGTP